MSTTEHVCWVPRFGRAAGLVCRAVGPKEEGNVVSKWDGSLNGKKCEGPGGCGHALSRHNSLSYCRHWSKRDGHCICGDWRAEAIRDGRSRGYMP